MKIRVHDIGETFDAYSVVSTAYNSRQMFANLDYLMVQQHQSSQNILQKLSRRFTFHSKVFSKLLVRSQFVRIKSTLSDSLLVSHEVPQRAIYSPFCIYINDLPFAS